MSISQPVKALPSLFAVALASFVAGGTATAAPLATAKATLADQGKGLVQDVRHRRWSGGGIYIGRGGYYPRYGYFPSKGYYPTYGRYSYYNYPPYGYRYGYVYDDGYRPYRTYNRRWVRERFEHPLGRR